MDALFGPEQSTNVAFMTTQDRQMYPTQMPYDRFGNEMNPMKGAPQRGPGCYENEEKTNFMYGIENKLVSTRGYTLGARTGPRFPKGSTFKTPSPDTYQDDLNVPRSFVPANKPFQVGTDRFHVRKKDLTEVVPGAGTYEHDIKRSRHVQWHQSFGGAPVFLPPVSVKSTIQKNTDKLYSTKEEKRYHQKLAYLKLYY